MIKRPSSLRRPLLIKENTPVAATGAEVSAIITVILVAAVITFNSISFYYDITSINTWPQEQQQLNNVNTSLHAFDTQMQTIQTDITWLINYFNQLNLIVVKTTIQQLENITQVLNERYALALNDTITRVNNVTGPNVDMSSSTLSIGSLNNWTLVVSGAPVQAALQGLSTETEILLQNAIETEVIVSSLFQEAILSLGGSINTTNVTFQGACGIQVDQTNFSGCGGISFDVDLLPNCSTITLLLNQTMTNVSSVTETQLQLIQQLQQNVTNVTQGLKTINGIAPGLQAYFNCTSTCYFNETGLSSFEMHVNGFSRVNDLLQDENILLVSGNAATLEVTIPSANQVVLTSPLYTVPETCVQYNAVLTTDAPVIPAQNNWYPVVLTISQCVDPCCPRFTTTCGPAFLGCNADGWQVLQYTFPQSVIKFRYPASVSGGVWSVRVEVFMVWGTNPQPATAVSFALISGVYPPSAQCTGLQLFGFGTSVTTFNAVNSNTLATWFSGTLIVNDSDMPNGADYTLCMLVSGPGNLATPAAIVYPTLIRVT